MDEIFLLANILKGRKDYGKYVWNESDDARDDSTK